MSVDIAAPQPCAPESPGVEGQVDPDRHGHPAERGDHRQREPAALAQLAEVELASSLQPDDEEEERHQTLVHPLAQVLVRCRAAELDREVGVQTDS